MWQVWADPRQLERWWGPPTYPATFTEHDLTPGGRVAYHMTGPEGDQPKGWWEILETDPPRSLVFRDGFANDDGTPNPEFPATTVQVAIEDVDGGRSRMSIETLFPSAEAHGAARRHGHGGRPDRGRRAGRRDPRRGRRSSATAWRPQRDPDHNERSDVMTEPTTHTLDVPGATLTYDIRQNDSTTEPPLFLIGSPMGASGFGTLAGHFPDRTVITYDPRGVERSTKDDPSTESTPDQHADDLHRVIEAIGVGPVDLFASSGGAVNALALVARHPEDVRTRRRARAAGARCLPDREEALGRGRAIRDTYQREAAWGAGMAKFIAIVSHKGPIPAELRRSSRDPDPAMFGLPTEDDGSRTDALLAQNMIIVTNYELDFDALRAASTRIVIAAGAEVGGRHWPIAPPSASPSDSGSSWSSSRAATAVSSAASTASRASPMPSPRSCARSLPPRRRSP